MHKHGVANCSGNLTLKVNTCIGKKIICSMPALKAMKKNGCVALREMEQWYFYLSESYLKYCINMNCVLYM